MNIVIQVLLILALSGCNSNSAGTNPAAPPPVPSQEQPEVLNQGPIHEGFAQPVDLNPQPGILAPNEPPPPIIENPSAERPKGSNYVWIPGYWAWDTDRKGYIWVSGCWRIAPANMSWVPGYWTKVSDGWQWVAGTGTDAAPYFRVFNPTLQGIKFDPQGAYVRRWVPELTTVPNDFIHAPWKMPADVQRRVGCFIGKDYPAPLVDHALARDRVLNVFKVKGY